MALSVVPFVALGAAGAMAAAPDRQTQAEVIGDYAAAATAAAMSAPLVACVDVAITKNTAGTERMWPSFFQEVSALARQPLAALRRPTVGWLFMLYVGTYGAANSVRTVTEARKVDSTVPVLAASTVANGSISIAKDRAFARMFGAIQPTTMPGMTYSVWLARDVLSVSFFFTVPPVLSEALSECGASRATADGVAYFTSPLVAQLFCTPLHLLGLDLYNRRGASPRERGHLLRKELAVTVAARCARMIPAFSLGGVVNRSLRVRLHDST